MTYQIVPPDDHCRNISEKLFNYGRNNFFAVLSGASSTLPLRLWCHAIPQAERQLLILYQSITNPNILSYAHLYDAHDYSSLPFVPIVMETPVHDKPTKQRS